MATVGKVYKEKFKRKLDEFNHSRPLVDYLVPFLVKPFTKIADIGAGPMVIIGDYWNGVDIEVVASDILVPEYQELWSKYNATPMIPVEYEDMENLSYEDESFDIVHCRNALDHTPDAYKAIGEMKRICKTGGYVYLAHAPSQKKIFGGHHYHNFEDLLLPEFSSEMDGELIVNIWKKI